MGRPMAFHGSPHGASIWISPNRQTNYSLNTIIIPCISYSTNITTTKRMTQKETILNVLCGEIFHILRLAHGMTRIPKVFPIGGLRSLGWPPPLCGCPLQADPTDFGHTADFPPAETEKKNQIFPVQVNPYRPTSTTAPQLVAWNIVFCVYPAEYKLNNGFACVFCLVEKQGG